MVIDDEEDTTLLLKRYLQSSDYVVDSYTDPVKALSSFKPHYYDLILLDASMPSMNGFDLYQRLKQIDSSCKVCFITAFEAYYISLKEFFPKLDVNCFIQKPVTKEKLLHCVTEQLDLG
jgi:two-component SAPR family response regulator